MTSSVRLTRLALLLLLPLLGMSVSAYAATCNASPTYTSIQTCINNAANGDTVLVSAGTVSGTPPLTISGKYITLQASGTVTFNGAGNNLLSISQVNGGSTRVTGFTFNNNNACPNDSCVSIVTTGTSTNAPFRLDHNFINCTGNCESVAINGQVTALLDHNTMTGGAAAEMIHNLGNGFGNTTGWSNDVVPGSANMVFIEDNTFTGTDSSILSKAVENFYSARVVFRHNTMQYASFDAHGNSGNPNGNINTRWIEVYQNNFNAEGKNQCCYITMRGGAGVIWGNTESGTNTVTGNIQLQEDMTTFSSCSPPDPNPYHVGSGITTFAGFDSTPVQLWGNTSTIGIGGDACTRQNFEYFINASQPVTMPRCESAADVAAGCPVSYSYIPYTYPNPLQGGGPQPAFTPSPVIFGTFSVGSSSTPTTVRITNNGVVPLTVGVITITGTNPGDFTRSSDTCTNTSVPANGGTCTLTVTFAPTATGTRVASLTIPDNSGNPDTIGISGTGSGVSPTPPVVTVTSPLGGHNVTGTINLTTTCSVTGASIASVQLQIGYDALHLSNYGSVGVVSPFTQTLDTTTAANGTLAISATCTDSSGNVGNATPITVTVNNTLCSGGFTSNYNFTTAVPFTTQSGTFQINFCATPHAPAEDVIVALSTSPAAAYADTCCSVHFNPSGTIDALNGTFYSSATTTSYTPGVNYCFNEVVNLSTHLYSVNLISPGAATIATNWNFRSTQSGATSLSYLNGEGSLPPPNSATVCSISLSGGTSTVRRVKHKLGGGRINR